MYKIGDKLYLEMIEDFICPYLTILQTALFSKYTISKGPKRRHKSLGLGLYTRFYFGLTISGISYALLSKELDYTKKVSYTTDCVNRFIFDELLYANLRIPPLRTLSSQYCNMYCIYCIYMLSRVNVFFSSCAYANEHIH